ncbi:hypothetical protein [Streptomyces sp. NPDC088726]|uniref:hypothetical protein n=1 Tax=Streptomyces sp. NPDC088726 TaxID=3365874 RepID=UPI0038265DC7
MYAMAAGVVGQGLAILQSLQRGTEAGSGPADRGDTGDRTGNEGQDRDQGQDRRPRFTGAE